MPSRRRGLQTTTAFAASALVPMRSFAVSSDGDIVGRLARYMVAARSTALPPKVVTECKHHILDTFGAMVSGSRMKPGEAAVRYFERLGGTAEA